MLEFVNSGLYFVQDENNFINPLLQAVAETFVDYISKFSQFGDYISKFGQISK